MTSGLRDGHLSADADVGLADAARRVAAAACRRDVIDVRHIEQGVMTYKFLVRMRRGAPVIVRFYPPNRRHVVDFEPDLLRAMNALGVKAPQHFADSRAGPAAPLAYVVYRYVEGEALSLRLHSLTLAQLKDLMCEVNEQTRTGLWSSRVAGFGDLKTVGEGTCALWREWIADSFGAILSGPSPHGGLTPPLREALTRAAEAAGKVVPPAYSSLAWGDISPDNILVDGDGRLAAIIDFEGVLAGEPALQIGYAQSRYAGTVFWEAYRNVLPATEDPRRIALYSVLRGLRLLMHAGEPLPTGRARDRVTAVLPGWLPSVAMLNER